MHQAFESRGKGRGNGTRLTARNGPILQGRRQKTGAGFVVQGYDGLFGGHSKAGPREWLLDFKAVQRRCSWTEGCGKCPSGSPGDMHDGALGRKRRGSRRKAGKCVLNGSLKVGWEKIEFDLIERDMTHRSVSNLSLIYMHRRQAEEVPKSFPNSEVSNPNS